MTPSLIWPLTRAVLLVGCPFFAVAIILLCSHQSKKLPTPQKTLSCQNSVFHAQLRHGLQRDRLPLNIHCLPCLHHSLSLHRLRSHPPIHRQQLYKGLRVMSRRYHLIRSINHLPWGTLSLLPWWTLFDATPFSYTDRENRRCYAESWHTQVQLFERGWTRIDA